MSAFNAGLSAFPAVVYNSQQALIQTHPIRERDEMRLFLVFLELRNLHTPPSTGMISPVIHPASLLERNRIAKEEKRNLSKGADGKGSMVSDLYFFLTVANIPPGPFFLHEILVDARFSHLVGHPAPTGHGRVYHPRTDAVHAYILLAVVGSHGACHLDNSSFGGGIKQARIPAKYYSQISNHCVLNALYMVLFSITHAEQRFKYF